MATEETDSRNDESRETGTEHAVPISERTVRVDHLSPAELRCGITLRERVEPDDPRQSSSADEDLG